MSTRIVTVYLLLVLSAAGLWAQASGTAPAPTVTVSPGRMQAARELYNLVGGKKVSQTAADALLNSLEQNPGLDPYKDILKSWSDGIFASKEFEDKIITLYAAAFTTDELNQLADFYRTPLGVKSLSLFPELSQKGAQIGMDEARAKLPDLQAMIEKRRKELGTKNGTGTPPAH